MGTGRKLKLTLEHSQSTLIRSLPYQNNKPFRITSGLCHWVEVLPCHIHLRNWGTWACLLHSTLAEVKVLAGWSNAGNFRALTKSS